MCGKLSPPGIYLLRWGGLGKGAAGAARLCHGRSSRNRQEPVLVHIPIPRDYCDTEVECDAALMATWSRVCQQNITGCFSHKWKLMVADMLFENGETMQQYWAQSKRNHAIWLGMSCYETKNTSVVLHEPPISITSRMFNLRWLHVLLLQIVCIGWSDTANLLPLCLLATLFLL